MGGRRDKRELWGWKERDGGHQTGCGEKRSEERTFAGRDMGICGSPCTRSLNCPNIWGGGSASPPPTQTAGGGSHYATEEEEEEEESPFAGKYPYSSVREQKGGGAKKSRRQYCALPSSFHGVTLGRRRKDHPWTSLSYAAQRHIGESSREERRSKQLHSVFFSD